MSREPIAVFLLTFGFVASLASVGFYISDEADLATAAYGMFGGDLSEGAPTEYYQLAHGEWEPRLNIVLGTAYTSETRAVGALSFPVHAMLLISSIAISPLALVAFVASAALGVGAAILMAPRWGQQTLKRSRIEQGALGAITIVAGSVSAITAPRIDPIWLTPLAMQITTMIAASAGAAAIWSFTQRRTGEARRASVATVILVFGTTFAFWAFGQKYHGLQLAALCGILLLRFAPGTRPLAHAAAWTLAGLSFWLHIKSGLVIVGALGIAEVAQLWRMRRERSALGRRAAVLAIGFALGIAPLVIESAVLYETPLAVGYGSSVAGPLVAPTPSPSEDTGAVPPPSEPVIVAPSFWSILLASLRPQTILEDPLGFPAALWDAWISPGMLTERVTIQFGILMVAPILAAAPFGLLRPQRQRDAADAFLAIHLAALLFVYGIAATRAAGGAYESRYLYIAYPALALWAADWIAPRVERSSLRACGPLVLLAGGITVAFLLAMTQARGDYTLQFHIVRRLGLAVAALVASWAIIELALARARGRGAWLRHARAPVVALALVPTLLFLAQFALHYPPRTAYSAEPSGADVGHFLSWSRLAHAALVSLLGI